MIEKAKVEKIIESLNNAVMRPQMYFGVDDNPSITQSFLDGINQSASIFFDVEPYFIISKCHDAIEKRGHRLSARGPIKELEEEGLTRKEIVDELLRIHISLYESLLKDCD
jgi:hypothetical protein